MKKQDSPADTGKAEQKSAFYQAGEMIGSIGFRIVDGKDKLMSAVSGKFGAAKKAIESQIKNQKPESKTKKPAKKKSPAKISKTGGANTKKANPAKPVKKKVNKVKSAPKAG
jgi:hypothetical protein